MILTFLKYGRGKGRKPVAYACDSTKPNGTRRSVAPRVLEGNPQDTRRLIDACTNEWKYTSAVISFTPGEYSEELARKVIADYKAAAFPGLAAHQVDLLAVLHLDTDNPHIHLITPRLELTTSLALNIAPPTARRYWSDWSTLTRDRHRLAPVEKPNPFDVIPLTKYERQIKKHGLKKYSQTQQKMDIHKIIQENVACEFLQTRQDVVLFLRDNGFEIASIKPSSISIKGEHKNIRLTGEIYADSTDRYGKTYREIFEQSREAQKGHSRDLRHELDAAKERFHTSFKSKFDANTVIYGKGKQKESISNKKILLKNVSRAEEGKIIDTNNLQHDGNHSYGPKVSLSTAQDLDTRIINASLLNMAATGDDSAFTSAQLSELIAQKMMRSAEAMTPRYRP